MPLLVNSVPNLAQGVSQQPDSLRLPGQCEEQVNAWATVVEGLVKRPNTNFVSKVSTDDGAGLFTHFVKRDEDNKYCVTVSLGGVGVIDLEDGTHISVATTPTASIYLSGTTSPLTDIRALTVADYTFLVNKKKTVLKSTDEETQTKVLAKEALISVNLGDYEKEYGVFVDDELINYDGSAPDPTNPTHTIGNRSHSFEPEGEATYRSGAGTTSGYNADTNRIAADLASLINYQLTTINATSTSQGVEAITISGGAGFPYTGEPFYSNHYGRWVGTYARNDPASLGDHIQITFSVYQSGSEASARGLLFTNKDDGSISRAILTNKGKGFNPSSSFSLRIDIKRMRSYNTIRVENGRDVIGQYPGAPWNIEFVLPATAADKGYTFPTLSTPSVPSVSNTYFSATVKQSIIKIKSENYVSHNSQVYKLLKEHDNQTSIIEPGVTTGWTEYWEEENTITNAKAWSNSSNYFFSDFTLRTTDGLANEGLTVIYKEVDAITDLPKSCYNDFRVKVTGDTDVNQDDYYVIFKTKDGASFGEGSWIETVGWDSDKTEANQIGNLQNAIDPTTMPVTLVPTSFDSSNNITGFILESPNEALTKEGAVGWTLRQAGNNDNNPFPSFINKTINDVFFFKNRLGFLTDSNVIFSEADEYYNFFRTTTQQLLDSAPIDVGLSHTKVARLQYAKAFQEKLMLFSDSSQFVLRGADVLSPKTVAISPVSEYDTTDNVEPLVLGNYIYFPFNRDKYVGMYEYYVDNNTEVFEAQEITEHVTKYIPSTIRMMAGSTTQNTVLVQSLAEQSSLYVYKYFWSGKEKIQSAWQKFTFNGGVIRGFDFVDSTLYLLVSRGGSLYLEKLFLEEGYVDRREVFGEYFFWDPAYPILLDCSTSSFEGVTHAYDAVNDVTTLSTIPINISADDVDSGVLQIWSKYGRKYDFTRVDDTTITINGRLYDYVTYNGVIYKCLGSHDSGFRDKPFPFQGNPNFRPGGSQAVNWTTLTGDEATIVTSAPDWEENVWYEGVENFVIGYSYNMLYKFSEQTLKQPTERGGRSASNYTYQTLRTGSLNYADTGHFTILVTPKHRDTYYYPFNSNLLGEGALVNKFTPQDGHFQFPIQAQPDQVDIEIRNDSALPVKLLGAEFESMIIPRTRRYGA
jgi:hypothetical protein